MTPQLALLGENPRLRRTLEPLALPRLSPEDDFRRKAILFAVAVDDFGADPAFYTLLRRLRAEPDALDGATVAMVVDGTGELYTKAAAQALTLAATMAGAYLPGRALVEATGSLYNHHIQAANWSLSWEETYFRRVRELAARLAEFTPPRFARLGAAPLQHPCPGAGGLGAPGAPLRPPGDCPPQRRRARLPWLRVPPVPALCPECHVLLWRRPLRGGLPGHPGKRPIALSLPQL